LNAEHVLRTAIYVVFALFVAGSAGLCMAWMLDAFGVSRTLSGGAGGILFGITVIVLGNALFTKHGAR
jgi:hypothetical protein